MGLVAIVLTFIHLHHLPPPGILPSRFIPFLLEFFSFLDSSLSHLDSSLSHPRLTLHQLPFCYLLLRTSDCFALVISVMCRSLSFGPHFAIAPVELLPFEVHSGSQIDFRSSFQPQSLSRIPSSQNQLRDRWARGLGAARK